MSPKLPPVYPGEDHCSVCNAFWPIGEEQSPASGYCLRYPPQVRFGTYYGQPGDNIPTAESYYPEVLAGWWCREFQKVV